MTKDDQSVGQEYTGTRHHRHATISPDVGGLYVAPASWCVEFCAKADAWMEKRGLKSERHPWVFGKAVNDD